MSEETLLDILDQDVLNVNSEVYLFNVVQSWVLFNVNRTGNKSSLLPHGDRRIPRLLNDFLHL